jgi:hypothetical protein
MNMGGVNSGIPTRIRYGRVGDVPIAGDWDGDGVTSIGVIRQNRWLPANNANNGSLPSFDFGVSGASYFTWSDGASPATPTSF